MAQLTFTVITDKGFTIGKLFHGDECILTHGGQTELIDKEIYGDKPREVRPGEYERYFAKQFTGKVLEILIGDRLHWSRSGCFYLAKSPAEKVIEQLKDVIQQQ